MATTQILNASPKVISLGTKDSSTRQQPRTPIQIPQHLAKFYLYTKSGKVGVPEIGVGSDLQNIFGIESFTPNTPYFNHASIYATQAIAQGNQIMVQRVIPDDAGPEANVTLWLDVQSTDIQQYERNTDGTFNTDISGNLIPITGAGATLLGHNVKWIIDYSSTVSDLNTKFGTLTSSTGTIGSGATASTKYPILQFKTTSRGSDGNNKGFRLWAPTTATVNLMPYDLMTKEKVYPFFIAMIDRDNANVSSKIVPTLLGDQHLEFVFKPNTIDPNTAGQLYINDILLDAYRNTTDPTIPNIYGNFDDLHVYQANIDLLLNMFTTSELANGVLSYHDFTNTTITEQLYLFNIISGVTSTNAPYTTFNILNSLDTGGTNAILLSNQTDVWASGGSDGTMSDINFDTLVGLELDKYSNFNSPMLDTAINPESWFYDSGFSLQTKYKLCNFVSLRKDTFLVLTTYQVGQPLLDYAGELSTATALNAHLSLYPESDYFATPVMRSMIVGFNGKLINSPYKNKVPLSIEVLINSAQYFGAADGNWKNGFSFDGAPGSIVKHIVDLNVRDITAVAKNNFWQVGLVWAQPYDFKSYFIPAFKTVYSNDTSVLTSYITAAGICQLNKVSQAAWREFSGVSNLTPAQLVERVNNFIIRNTQGRFDNRFVIQPDTQITAADALRGYSWTLVIKLYAANMKTVMTTYVEAFRLEDLPANTTI